MGPPPVWSSALMIPKSVFQVAGAFPVGVRRAGDLTTWAQIALRYRIAWSPVTGAIYHLSADNRACVTHAAPPDFPGASSIEKFLAADCQPIAPRDSIVETLVFLRLELVKHFCLNGQRSLALDLLAKTRDTVLFARTRRKLSCLVWVPSAFLRATLKLKAVARTTRR